MKTPMASVIHSFIMSPGSDIAFTWDLMEHTNHQVIGQIYLFMFILMAFLLLLNLLIAMMGDTYNMIAEIKNEWIRQVGLEAMY